MCISAPAMPLPPAPPSPGPGSYEMVDYEGAPKHYMSSAAFVSASNRWTGDATMLTVDLPGPGNTDSMLFIWCLTIFVVANEDGERLQFGTFHKICSSLTLDFQW